MPLCKLLSQSSELISNSCDLKLDVQINRNTKIQFYDSLGNSTWYLENDTIDFIDIYFHSNLSYKNLVRIDSLLILLGENKNGYIEFEYEDLEKFEIIELLKGSWVNLSDCHIELNEWMLTEEYQEPYIPYIYDSPDLKSTKTMFDPKKYWTVYKIKIIEARGTWLNVELTFNNTTKKGWMPNYNLCSHPLTTCN